MLRFAGFELDEQRGELRGADGAVVRLRPKTFDLLLQLAGNAGRVLSKDELMAAVWPNVLVSDDSLFQCIRELRLALHDEQRQLIKAVSGRGYRFDAEVAGPAIAASLAAAAEGAVATPIAGAPAAPLLPKLAAVAIGLVALVVAVLLIRPDLVFPRAPSIAVMPIGVADGDVLAAQMASSIANRLSDGLAGITGLQVLAPGSAQADLVISGELGRSGTAWTVEARLTSSATHKVEWTRSVTIDAAALTDLAIQQSRLAAGLGHDIALYLNGLPDARATSDTSRVLIEQATAYMNQTSLERFQAAQDMLEQGLAADASNPDIQAALAAVLLRGVQMVWYPPDENAAARKRAGELLASALKGKPNSVPVQEANCRFMATTNQFKQSLVICARTLEFDPWDGIALYHFGLSQLYLGRFEEAVTTFRQADQYDTPEVSRWTWKLGMGWALLLMDRPAEALPWLEQAIAITPASGRAYLLVAAAQHQLGHLDEAAAAMAKCLELRPGSTVANVGVPTENASPVFIAQSNRLLELGVAAGLPRG